MLQRRRALLVQGQLPQPRRQHKLRGQVPVLERGHADPLPVYPRLPAGRLNHLPVNVVPGCVSVPELVASNPEFRGAGEGRDYLHGQVQEGAEAPSGPGEVAVPVAGGV